MIRKIYYFLILLTSIISIYLGFNSTIIPNIILYILIAFYLINLIILYPLIAKKRRKSKKRRILTILGILLSLILIIINIVLVFVYIKSNSFFNKITNVEYETTNYSLIVLKDTEYKYITDLTTIGIYHNELDKNYEAALKKVNAKVNISEREYTNIALMITDLISKKIDGIFINDIYIDIIAESKEDFEDYINVIDTIGIDSLTNNDDDIDITKLKSFNLYISGIDVGGSITRVSRSDVNIIATINLETNKILLTNTPRDYYVQLVNTTGLRDKLTHAGIYGIDTSIGTLENLYDIDISYYVRVNFESLIKVVDAIGGIDVYSDRNFATTHFYFKEGWNYMNGKKALAYSRTRKIYESGDRHRGQNQQQVIEAIIKKVTKSNNLTYYLNLLNSLEDSFQTNIDKKSINNLINLQVKNNYEWNIESISVDGEGKYNYSYSYPDDYNYVMEPDLDTVEAAKKRIKEVLKESKK